MNVQLLIDSVVRQTTVLIAQLATSGGGGYAPYIGGSTYSFDVGEGHPLRDEVLQTLHDFRQRCTDLRQRVAEHNDRDDAEPPTERVVVYAGQTVYGDAADSEKTAQPRGDIS